MPATRSVTGTLESSLGSAHRCSRPQGLEGRETDDKGRKRLLVKQPEIRKEKQLLGEKSQPGGGKRMVAGGVGSLESCRAGAGGSHLVFVAVSCPVCAGSGGTRHIPEPCLGSTPTTAPTFRIPPQGWGRRWSPLPKGGVAESAGLGQLGGFGEEQGGGRLG